MLGPRFDDEESRRIRKEQDIKSKEVLDEINTMIKEIKDENLKQSFSKAMKRLEKVHKKEINELKRYNSFMEVHITGR